MEGLNTLTQIVIHQDIYEALNYKLTNQQIAQRVAQTHNVSEKELIPVVKRLRKEVNREEWKAVMSTMPIPPKSLLIFGPIVLLAMTIGGPAIIALEGAIVLVGAISWLINKAR